MKNRAIVCVLVIVVFVTFGFWIRGWSWSLKPTTDEIKTMATTKTEEPAKDDSAKTGPLSFWNGEVIIGEGRHHGSIELVGHPGEKSVEVCALDAFGDGMEYDLKEAGMKAGEIRISLSGRGHTPLVTFSPPSGEKKSFRMWSVLGLSEAMKQGKLTPIIVPDIISPVERIYRKKGQILEGYVWSIHSCNVQKYGNGAREEENRSQYGSEDVELAPDVKVCKDPEEIDLGKQTLGVKELAKIQEEDSQNSKKGQAKNSLKSFVTAKGTFKVVSCFGRQSVSADSMHSGGWRFDMVQLPSGKWTASPLNIHDVFEADGDSFLICDHYVFKVLGNDKILTVVSFENIGTKWSPSIRSKDLSGKVAGKYWEVHKSNESDFGGLLEYAHGKWIFHCYRGDYRSFVVGAEEAKGGKILLCLFDNWKGKSAQKKIEFDPVSGGFDDL